MNTNETTMDASTIARMFQAASGNTDAEMLDLALTYIDNQGSNDAFADFCTDNINVTDALSRDSALHDALTGDDTDAKLTRLEAEFDAAGGRGPDLADEIDRLRLKLHPEDYPELVAAAVSAADYAAGDDAIEFDPMYQGAEAEDRHEAGEL